MSDLKRNCKHYNWGGKGDLPTYPREMGARCEKKNRFFEHSYDCDGCIDFESEPKPREQAFIMTYKVGMINLWRKRCTEHLQLCGKKVNPSDCKTCNEVAKEIVDDLKECTKLRAFKG